MVTSDWWTELFSWVGGEQLGVLLRALIILGVGFILARLVDKTLQRIFSSSPNLHQTLLIRRGSYYLLLGLFITSALHEIGFGLNVLLGTAGILTVAIGFASQTSMSNLISGLFLVGEKPFALGDVIKVGETTGIVLSIDLLSVKLRTFDNTFVRIPNEMLIKSQVTTLTKFPIRRIDLKIKIAYKEAIQRVRQILFAVADKNPLALVEPEPLFIFQGFGESGMDIQFSVWVQRDQYLNLLNSIHEEVKIAFDEAGVEIPLPNRNLYTGSATEPFPIQIVSR